MGGKNVARFMGLDCDGQRQNALDFWCVNELDDSDMSRRHVGGAANVAAIVRLVWVSMGGGDRRSGHAEQSRDRKNHGSRPKCSEQHAQHTQ
jgi:hypothetical protein